MSKVPLTIVGAELMRQELHRLKTIERPSVINAISPKKLPLNLLLQFFRTLTAAPNHNTRLCDVQGECYGVWRPFNFNLCDTCFFACLL